MQRRHLTTIIDVQRVVFVNGMMLLALTVFMLPPAFTDLVAHNPNAMVFAISAFITGFLGLMMVIATRGSWSDEIYLKEGFVLTVSSWLVLSSFASIPFLLYGNGMTLVDSWFETVSGLTTTGATVMTSLDDMPPGILLWRSTIAWIGGIGIVLMAIIMLPFLKVGGMQLFQTENSDRSEKFVPRAGELMRMIVWSYLSLTILCGLSYSWAGMSAFDAVNHAMTTMATSGYSTHDNSFNAFTNPRIHWISSLFMLAASLPLALYVRTVKTRSLDFWNDTQVRGFLKLVTTFIVIITLSYSYSHDKNLLDSMRLVVFNVLAIISTTGFVLDDYTTWGAGAVGVFFLLTFLGGCTGSTSGGVKTFRLQVMLRTANNYISRLMSPNRVAISTFNGKKLTTDISISVLAYISVMFVSVMVFTMALTVFGLDFVTSISGATTALTNVGPGLGDIIGPSGNYSTLPDGAKFILTIAMLLGRLEFFTFLVVFSPSFWR